MGETKDEELHAKLDKLMDLVSTHSHELKRMQKGQDDLRAELSSLREEQERLQAAQLAAADGMAMSDGIPESLGDRRGASNGYASKISGPKMGASSSMPGGSRQPVVQAKASSPGASSSSPSSMRRLQTSPASNSNTPRRMMTTSPSAAASSQESKESPMGRSKTLPARNTPGRPKAAPPATVHEELEEHGTLLGDADASGARHVEDEAWADMRRGGIYGLSQPLLKPGTKEKLKQQSLSRVAEALKKGESPHTWAGPGTPLRAGVQSRSLDMVRCLLDNQGNPDERDNKGVSLIHMSSFDGQVEMSRLLLEMHADPNAVDRYGQTPLFFAPTRGVCELLFKAYADVNTMNHRGQSALHLAAKAGLGDVLIWFSSRVTLALLCLRDAHGSFVTDYARRAGVRPEAILSLEKAAHGGLTRSWREYKMGKRMRGTTKDNIAPGFEVAGHDPDPEYGPGFDLEGSDDDEGQ
eukprot:TRINITY_DN21016_c0_g1_i1.p1 TRINITY_DN21016_c0_g1~~TRINITY_DN21016_c0_g1_i1.p1  ORF type:complete len:468 (+),score=104.37 TRINITY_DN21016_c0_g1_i1:68-1471(+)